MISTRPAGSPVLASPGSGGGQPPRDGRGMWWSRVFPGRLDTVRDARDWARGLVAEPSHQDDIQFVASELAANAVRHTRSGTDGGRFTVEILLAPGWSRVTVTDQGAATRPRIAQEMHGLDIISSLAANWGVCDLSDASATCRSVWADLQRPDGTAGAFPGGGCDTAALQHKIAGEFPSAVPWWEAGLRLWRAAPGSFTGPPGVLEAPSPYGLGCKLRARYAPAPGSAPGASLDAHLRPGRGPRSGGTAA